MSSWRDAILNSFVPNISKLTLVADPDNLLTEEKLVLALRQRGFDLLEFKDAIEFRYAYELNYRARWDRGDNTDLVVTLRLREAKFECLPFDLLQAGRQLAFDLGRFFPSLSYPVVEQLDRSLLDALFKTPLPAQRVGDNATKDFILRQVFGIVADLVTDDAALLRTLVRLHYNKTPIPPALADRLVQVLKQHGHFRTWPLDEIVPDEETFFAFLQERWPVFLSQFNTANQVREPISGYNLAYPGPDILPFDHEDIRVYIDNLFVEGKLTPVQQPAVTVDTTSWMRSGIIKTPVDDDRVRLSRLFKQVAQELPTLESRYADWIAFALKWAELSALIHGGGGQSNTDEQQFQTMGDRLNKTFVQWLSVHYASLINLPPSNPVMLHHVPRRLARDLEAAKHNRVALLVVDGLALDQWVSIRHILQQQAPGLVMRESAIFAWIPTLTSVSRQAIFAGKPPFYFPASISSTNSEAKLWKQFWESMGFSRRDIAYQRGLGDGQVASLLEANLHPGQTKVAGLVIDKLDKIMHGMQLGAAGMHNQIKQWCQGGFLENLINYLLDHGYDVWLTSDHGNIECRGRGRPSEGVIAETRGERVRVYPTPELRAQVAAQFPFAHEWQSIGLPSNYFPLVASSNDAFVHANTAIVGHGGIAVEEVIVPLVKFARKNR